jgi:hypothetical protein
MALKQRDYSNMKETERIWEAVDLNSTHVKDYSMKNVVRVSWQTGDYFTANHLAKIESGKHQFVGNVQDISRGVHELVTRQDKDDWLPKGKVEIKGWGTKPLIFDTGRVNNECLRDHVAEVTIGGCISYIDLEELLKATRYA